MRFAFKLFSLPFKMLLKLISRHKDMRLVTYYVNFKPPKLLQYIRTLPLPLLAERKESISALSALYLEHRFDLLGSGWVQVKHGMRCRGLEGLRYDMGKACSIDKYGEWLNNRINRANLAESKRIWSLIGEDYIPIDWHVDFKSGYRWQEDTWYKDIIFGQTEGQDIKVPWEISRMQHLVQLAYAYLLAKEGLIQPADPGIYAKEFRNQILDFIATNPPRFGVNWRCTMDVAIRAVNWLVAYDLFRAEGIEFDEGFNNIFSRSIYEHGLHIRNNLEWKREFRSNHYLADIAGLLFICAYLPSNPQTRKWLVFSVKELIREASSQFYPEGANIESSTSYHRLSSELVVFATALILGLPKEKLDTLKGIELFSPAYSSRLEKMADFTRHTTKPGFKIHQVGDNDSGRFLKLNPKYHRYTVKGAKLRFVNLDGYAELPDTAQYWQEDYLDHRHLIAAINALFGIEDASISPSLDSFFIKSLKGERLLKREVPSELKEAAIERDSERMRLQDSLDALPQRQKRYFKIPLSGVGLENELEIYAYPEFGLYIWQSRSIYLAIRCSSLGRNIFGSHAHNDQLAIELNINGIDLITDPGSYLYTPLLVRRNEFRSVKAHFTPQPDNKETGSLNLGVFRLGDVVKPACLYFNKNSFIGSYKSHGIEIFRSIQIMPDCIKIADYFKGNISPKDYNFKSIRRFPYLSAGYGVLLKNRNEENTLNCL